MARKKKSKDSQPVCIACPAICCHDLAIEIHRPKNKHEIENYKWYMHYDTVFICIRNHRWYLAVKGRCIYLDDNDMCTVYNDRPEKCREHNPPECEKFGRWYDVRIDTPAQLMDYLKPKKKKKSTKKKK
jgi:hypothetical protein